MIRDNNEDAYFVADCCRYTDSQILSCGIYLVADGMGGENAGEVASAQAIETISSSILKDLKSDAKPSSYQDLVRHAIERGNAEISSMAKAKSALASAGTTVTLGLRINNDLYLGHIGDSRCYLVHDGKLEQLTRDHSVVGELLRRGKITIEQAKHHPARGKLYRSLGSTTDITVDTLKETGYGESQALSSGDKVIFCSDGLTDYVSNEDILELVEHGVNAIGICHSLVQLANARGGADNVTVIVVTVT